jgi:hypothetical protein
MTQARDGFIFGLETDLRAVLSRRMVPELVGAAEATELAKEMTRMVVDTIRVNQGEEPF